jgi:histidinol phosphatase-like PHP family hydrolase
MACEAPTTAAGAAAGGHAVPMVSTHTHTNLSLCGHWEMTFDAVVNHAAELNCELLIVTDHVHSPEVTDYAQHLATSAWYRACRSARQPLMCVVIGAEFEVVAPGIITAPADLVAAAECAVVAPNHYQCQWIQPPPGPLRDAAAFELDNLATAISWPHTDIVAHPFAATGTPHAPDDLYLACDQGRLRELLSQAVATGIALELQPKFWRAAKPAARLAQLYEDWLALGGRVALGSDAHRLVGLTHWADDVVEISGRFGLTRDHLWWPDTKEG